MKASRRDRKAVAVVPPVLPPQRVEVVMVPAPAGQIEICRSFSFKLKTDVQYEMADFFCSRKETCSVENADRVAADAEDWCIERVGEDIAKFRKLQREKRQQGRIAS